MDAVMNRGQKLPQETVLVFKQRDLEKMTPVSGTTRPSKSLRGLLIFIPLIGLALLAVRRISNGRIN
jgi:hypothetical protein